MRSFIISTSCMIIVRMIKLWKMRKVGHVMYMEER
jgi:hypothetical protein